MIYFSLISEKLFLKKEVVISQNIIIIFLKMTKMMKIIAI
jgi:hypothetical protein